MLAKQTEIKRIGDWIETYSGITFYPLDPRPDDIFINDIAHSLSLLCRFNGHCRAFYSVGIHSILCAMEAATRELPVRTQLKALLHDSSEAYLADIPKPIKPYLTGYEKIEDHLQAMIYQQYGLDPSDKEEYKIIKDIDFHILRIEAELLMPSKGRMWAESMHLESIDISRDTYNLFQGLLDTKPSEIKKAFLKNFYKLII